MSTNVNYRVERTELGLDAGGEIIYEYDFIPTKYNRVVMLSAGMNAIELSGIFGIAYFMQFIMNRRHEDNSGAFDFLYNNVRFKVIPIICPSSFNREKLSYWNANGVNINRNFNFNGSWDAMESEEGRKNYKGLSPESELETKILKNGWRVTQKKRLFGLIVTLMWAITHRSRSIAQRVTKKQIKS